MSDNYYCNISQEKLDITKAIDFVRDNEYGALSVFEGIVRKHNLGKEVIAVEYDVFTELAISIFNNYCTELLNNYKDLRVYIEHYQGKLVVGESSIVIAVGSIHRKEAILSCNQLIEQIKFNSPIWKKEYYTDHESEWVKGHSLCKH